MIISEEKNLVQRATLIDRDISEIVREIGLKTTKKVLESTRDEAVLKRKERDGTVIHRNPLIEFNTIFGKIGLASPYLWSGGSPSRPLKDEMGITHQGRSEAVIRALSDFGIDESFAKAAEKFREHYHFGIGISTADRTTKEIAREASEYIDNKFSCPGNGTAGGDHDGKILIELDGCEIRTGVVTEKKNSDSVTPVYGNPGKERIINRRDVRLGFARPLEGREKIFAGKMDSYPAVVNHLHGAAELIGMTSQTGVTGVADGGIGLSEELKRRFPGMQFILDKSHLRDHLYETAEKTGICKKKRAEWVETRMDGISDGNVDRVLEELTSENEKNPCNRLKRLINYLNRFHDAVSYNSFREKGYPIGSGEIESAHKSVPQKRLKIPGATWHPDSINPMLALRILRADGWWDDFWTKRTEKLLAA